MNIWKYPIDLTGFQVVLMPEGAKILCVQIQNGKICLWARVDSNLAGQDRKILIRGTGQEYDVRFPYIEEYIGTVQHANGNLVWHVFEEIY